MSYRRILVSIFAFMFMVVLGTRSLRAQDETPTRITDQNRSGDLPFSSTVGTDLERVQIANGNLVVNIPILSVPGRAGLPFRFGIWYDNRFWTAALRTQPGGLHFQFWNMEKRFYLAPQTGRHGIWSATQHGVVSTSYQKDCGPRLTGPSGIVMGVGSVIYIDPAGGKHSMEAGHEDGSCVDPPGNWDFANTGPDTTGIGAFGDEQGIVLADGTNLGAGGLPVSPNDPPTCTGPCPITTAQAISTEVDSNGNIQGEFPGGQDTMGRSLLTQVQGTNFVQYKYKDSGGNDQTYTVNFQPLTVHTAFNVIGSYGALISEGGTTRQVESSLTLPNGRSYTFSYDSYGSLTSLGLPTGGEIDYTWQNFPCGDDTYRYVSVRRVIGNGQESVWTFNHSLTPGAQCYAAGPGICTSQVSTSCTPPITVTVTDPLGNQSVYTVMAGNVTSAKVYNGAVAAGILLRQYTIIYTNLNYPFSGGDLPSLWLPTKMVTQLENGMISEKDFQYDTLQYPFTECPDPTNCATFGPITFTKTTSRGNVTDTWEYDWGTPGSGTHGPLLSHSHKDYLHDAQPAYAAANIVSKVLHNIIYDGTGNKAAETDYEFDGTTPLATGGVPQHDYTRFSTANNVRGNVTRVKHWRNTDGALLATTLSYDDLGNIRSIQDPLGHQTSYDYTDSFANTACAPPANSQAWVSQVTNPLLQHIRVVRYPCTGLVQSHKDQNDINAGRAGTTFTYDVMGRPTQKNSVDGGQVSTAYNDVPPVAQTVTTKITSALSLVSSAIHDDLGRATQTQVSSDPEGTDYVDTAYDALSRAATVSNPYRNISDPTYGVTQTQYDTLGRVIQVTKQDHSIATVAYTGNCTTTTDEAGKQRKACSDSLGRLTKVWEDPSGLNYETDYQYDTLGNLLRVDQKGSAPADNTKWRTRQFTYNSLSQLLTASNPESGTVSYVYDPDGNVLQKFSPAPNQTGTATQTVSYCYDALNRPTKRDYIAHTYAPPACPITAPVVSYVYDVGTNGIGHLTSLTDQVGSGTYNYELMGRLSDEQRTIAGVSKSLSYTYKLDGSVATATYPSGQVITYSADAAGRVVSVAGVNEVSSGCPDNVDVCPEVTLYVNGATYGPDGQSTGFVSGQAPDFGTNGTNSGSTGITSAFSYNKRLQPIAMSASTPDQTVFSINYDFHVGNGTSGADNGNVWGITNNKDNTRNQSFTYDALNRLISAQNAGTDCNQIILQNKTKFWGNNYGYDAWGNLLSKNITKCGAENLGVTAGNNNQLQGGYLYDAAGNMTHDATSGLNYAYDQENRITGAGGFTYTYDGDGNRVKKANGSTGTLYWYMTPGIVGESDLSGNLTAEYVFFGGERVARMDFPGGEVSYYFSDHLKTASVITDSLGTVTSESDYYPWGGELQFTNNDSNHYKFTGKERDSETNLDYFGARYYSNGLGRFITPDWAAKPVTVPYAELGDPQTLNLYGYVRGLPTVKADLDGHSWWDKFKNALGEAACWCEGDEAEQHKAANRKRMEALNNPASPEAKENKKQLWAFAITISAYNAADMALEPPGEIDELGPVVAYEVDTYEELKSRSVVGDGLTLDHIPSNASNIAAREAELGRKLTATERAAVRDQGMAVAVPDALHKSASPTYGGRNTPAQIEADRVNPQAAAARDSQAMARAASAANRAKAQAAAAKISSGGGGGW